MTQNNKTANIHIHVHTNVYTYAFITHIHVLHIYICNSSKYTTEARPVIIISLTLTKTILMLRFGLDNNLTTTFSYLHQYLTETQSFRKKAVSIDG
jgi:hypothetical protein